VRSSTCQAGGRPDPRGRRVHELWVRRAGGQFERVHVFDGVTADGDVLTFAPATPLADVEGVRVVTISLGDLFSAWREIEIRGSLLFGFPRDLHLVARRLRAP